MAATGKTPILLYGSTTSSNVPVAGNLTNSSDGCEIAINVADKNLFFKDSTNVVNTVPIRQSSASSDGWLSSTDWTTFNNKVSSQWVTTGSNIYYTTGNVGIGTNNPTYKLVVQGSSGNTYTKIARDTQSTGEVGVYLAGGTSGVDWYVYQPKSNDELRFYSTSDRFVLDTSGNATIKNGNLVIGTSGKGIDFSATADGPGMTSELLADYEEGTFTPTLTASSSNPTMTYTLQRGEYVKVGSLVYVAVYMAWSARSGGSGDARFNLPFTTAASPGAYGAGAISNVTGVTFDSGRTFVAMQPQPNATYLNMVEMGSNASSITLTMTNFGTGAGSLSYTCTYKV